MGSGFLTPRESTMRGCLWWGRVGCSGSLAAQSRENQRCRCRGCARAPRAPRRPACLDGCVLPCSSFALRAQTCVVFTLRVSASTRHRLMACVRLERAKVRCKSIFGRGCCTGDHHEGLCCHRREERFRPAARGAEL